MSRASYFIGSRSLGSSEVRPEAVTHCFFCPQCGDIWARVIVASAPESRVLTAACERHENTYTYTGGQPPGSLLTPIGLTATEAYAGDALLPRSFPPALVAREARIHLALFPR